MSYSVKVSQKEVEQRKDERKSLHSQKDHVDDKRL